jgi:hypothetical protein
VGVSTGGAVLSLPPGSTEYLYFESTEYLIWLLNLRVL